MMLFPKSDIKEHLNSLGLNKNDTVMIHGDAGVAAQYIYSSNDDSLTIFINELINYFSEGTIIMPSFTYSATKGDIFDLESTPSDVGLLSEKFRLTEGVVRSNHPIFSICAIGNKAKYFLNSLQSDCFGSGTFFDFLYKQNAKVITLGCPLDRMTFIHYVEQKLNVSYRYFKKFPAQIKDKDIVKTVDVNYFVRNLDLNTELNLQPLEKLGVPSGKLTKASFGRFPVRIISTEDFFNLASSLILKDEYAFIMESKF